MIINCNLTINQKNPAYLKAGFFFHFVDYIFAVESIIVESVIVESIIVESIIVESIIVESIEVESASSDALLELQATTDKDNANAKKPILKNFFMLNSFNC
ncbi:hypothetical protein A5893_15060 [Pedobacter psychrophilus]|uniref:Uncharacterized protein n=1 Tax=Pedobacter psychrophilus TaxID=1826909 RepID=A0A179DAP6_9SPHI|nr:hypothetical protein A5893_15060 [Pedobacter psychrophilus]